jgi:hypothetical protein
MAHIHNPNNARRKAAAIRREAAKFKDGNGKHRVTVSRAKAAMKRKAVA